MIDPPESRSPERGSSLLLVLCLAALLSLLAMSLFFTTDVDFRTSKNQVDRVTSLADTDAALSEVIWRLNLTQGVGAPPTGSRISVNSLSNYDAAIDFDPHDLLVNGVDDDGDLTIDEVDELNLTRDWQARILLSGVNTNPGSPYEYADSDLASAPWGDKIVEPTIQAASSWKNYTSSDPASNDVMTLRFKLDTDTTVGDVDGDGPEIVFYDPSLATNGIDDKHTLRGFGGDTNAGNDSPYNISAVIAGTTYRASGAPVLLLRTTSRVLRGGREVARRRVEAELLQSRRRVFKKALCGCTELDLSGGGHTDSYRSSEGDYGDGAIYQNGDIGSNGTIDMGGGYVCNGSAESGGDQEYSGSNATVVHDAVSGGIVDEANINVHGTVTENKIPVPTPCECDTLDVVAMVAAVEAANDNATILPDNEHAYDEDGKVTKSPIYSPGLTLKLSSDDSIILTGGDYYFDAISLSGSSSIQIGVDSDSDGHVDGPPSPKVRIFVGGEVSLGGKGLVNFGRPVDAEIYVSGGDVSLSGSAEFRGAIYAPNSEVKLTGHSGVYGSVLGNEVKNTGGAGVHYDEDMGDSVVVLGPVNLLAWHEVP